jgi:hypothetical protein
MQEPEAGEVTVNTTQALTVAAAVVALTQFVKWSKLIPDKRGPLAVLLLSALGVTVWAWSSHGLTREAAFDLLSGFISVALSAAGVYGFTRSAPEAVSSFTPPPGSGAGSSPTT